MTVIKIDNKSTREEIQHFYDLYVESFSDLCIWKGDTIVNLGEYLEPTKKYPIFKMV
jgi:hypothetical protein